MFKVGQKCRFSRRNLHCESIFGLSTKSFLLLCKYDVVVTPLSLAKTEMKSEFARLCGILILTSHS